MIDQKRFQEVGMELLSYEECMEWLKEEPRRDSALDLYLSGESVTQIANKLGITRKTFYAWKRRPEFISEAKRRFEEFGLTRRLKRARQTTFFTDFTVSEMEELAKVRLEGKKKAQEAMQKGLPVPDVPDVSTEFGRLLSQYKSLRAEERVDLGENEVRVHHHVQGEVDHAHRIEIPANSWFEQIYGDALSKDVRLNRIKNNNVIDAPTKDGHIDDGKLLLAAVEEAIGSDETILDQVYADEIQLEQEELAYRSKTK